MKIEFKNRLRKGCACLVLLGAFAGSPVSAQEAAPPAAPAPVSRPLWLDGAITVCMIGLGLFVVVRGSNRT
ncbi:MAG TPA: hypothetical protein VNQ76_05505 [Planctomicrobium sp.]|nr:hypothetical protein [Planctomicrobium sp.]